MPTQYISCPNCHTQNLNAAGGRCTNCGMMLPVGGPMQPVYTQKPAGADKKLAAGLCGILLGGLGVHKFILGYQNEGIILLGVTLASWVITFITCGIGAPLVMIPSVIGIIEGIMYLTKSDEEFVQTYVVGRKPWF